MGRQRRINTPAMIHHVVNRGVDRQAIFFGDADRVEFGRLIGEIHDRFGITVIAYCLMDNHYHLILDCAHGHLSDAMQHLQSVFAAHVNARRGRDGHLFRGRFYSAMINSDRYLITAVRYVERNSLSLPGIEDPSEYRWSSVRARLGYKRSPTWLQTDRMLDYFADREAYFEFLCEAPSSTEPARIETADLDELARLMVALFATDDVNTAQLDRTVILAMATSLSQANRSTIGEHLGFGEAQTFRKALWRATRRAEAEPNIAEIAAELRRQAFDAVGANVHLRDTA